MFPARILSLPVGKAREKTFIINNDTGEIVGTKLNYDPVQAITKGEKAVEANVLIIHERKRVLIFENSQEPPRLLYSIPLKERRKKPRKTVFVDLQKAAEMGISMSALGLFVNLMGIVNWKDLSLNPRDFSGEPKPFTVENIASLFDISTKKTDRLLQELTTEGILEFKQGSCYIGRAVVGEQ